MEQNHEPEKAKKFSFSNLRDSISSVSKERLVIFLFLIISIPITVTLANEQQLLKKNAEEPSVLADNSRPNIVIIMLDDVNPMDGRFFTANRTPNIYKYITSKAINFTNFYVETTLCCPGRVGYMTGQHTQNHGVKDLDGTVFIPTETVATELHGVGYYNIFTGKYVNNYRNVPAKYLIPPGYDKFDALYENNGKYYNYQIIHKDKSTTSYGSAASDYSTDVISDMTLTRLTNAPSAKPIYLVANPYAIHNPHDPAPRHIGDSRCANIAPWDAPNVNEADVSDKSKFIRDLPISKNPYTADKVQCEMILSVDDMVGKIGAQLIKQRRLSNTIFILTADNGYAFKEHNLPAKTVPYATHVPLYIAWPDGRGTKPAVNNTYLTNIDFAPTFCELAGCVMGPYPNSQQTADGISFASLIKNQPYPYYRDAILESQPIKPSNASPATRPAWWAIRTTNQNPLGLWHYIEYATGEKELYDLSNGPCYKWKVGQNGDPCELDNLLSANSKRTAPTNISEIQSALANRLSELKNEKGVIPVLINSTPTPTTNPSLTPTPTVLISATLTPTPTIGAAQTQTTVNLLPKADSYVRNDNSATNYGSSTTLNTKASGPISSTYLKFALPNLTGKTVDSVILRLSVNNNPDSAVGPANKIAIKSVDPGSWTETGLKYSNKPTSGSVIATKDGSINAGSTIDINIPISLPGKTNGIISFVLESISDNTNNLIINSKEAASRKPTLIITYH